jgi:hypothetical protein
MTTGTDHNGVEPNSDSRKMMVAAPQPIESMDSERRQAIS